MFSSGRELKCVEICEWDSDVFLETREVSIVEKLHANVTYRLTSSIGSHRNITSIIRPLIQKAKMKCHTHMH